MGVEKLDRTHWYFKYPKTISTRGTTPKVDACLQGRIEDVGRFLVAGVWVYADLVVTAGGPAKLTVGSFIRKHNCGLTD